MCVRLLTGPALLVCATAFAQIGVYEGATQARLVNHSTSISLAIRNQFAKPVEVRVELAWIDPAGRRHRTAQVTGTARPGVSSIETSLPLEPASDHLFLRLHYAVLPGLATPAAFLRFEGMLSLPRIASHAYRLSTVGIGPARPKQPYEFHVIAHHPLTFAPVEGVRLFIDDAGEKVLARTGADGRAIVRFMPEDELEEWDTPEQVTIRGQLGDLQQETEVYRPAAPPDDVRIYTDKPIYQPGRRFTCASSRSPRVAE